MNLCAGRLNAGESLYTHVIAHAITTYAAHVEYAKSVDLPVQLL